MIVLYVMLVKYSRRAVITEMCINNQLININQNQIKMKIRQVRSYRSKNGNPTFVYAVSGNTEQLAAFKTAQGEYYREDTVTGEPLWFTTRSVGQVGSLIITTKGNIVPDMSAFDQAASIASQYGGNFGQELARQAAMQILGGANHASTPASAPAQVAKADENLDAL